MEGLEPPSTRFQAGASAADLHPVVRVYPHGRTNKNRVAHTSHHQKIIPN